MLLIEAHAWVRKYFAHESRPAELTVRRWMRVGKVPARKAGGTWYGDEHAWLAGGDELVLRILQSNQRDSIRNAFTEKQSSAQVQSVRPST